MATKNGGTRPVTDHGRWNAVNRGGRGVIAGRAAALLGCLAVFPGFGQAAEWDLTRSISVSEVYTDNLRLDDTNKQDSFITQIAPRMSLRGKGAGATVDLSASLRYDKGGNADGSLTPRLSGKAKAELVGNSLFVDADAYVSQNAINPYGNISLDNLNKTGNTTTTIQYGISPYYTKRIHRVGDLLVRYRYTNTSHSESAASGSGSHQLTGSLKSTPGSSRLSWGLDGKYRKSTRRGAATLDLRSFEASLGYRLDRQWLVDGSVGREWNDFVSTRTRQDGFRWTVNTTWTPNPRTSLRLGYGGRFFGSTPSLDLSYRSRRSTLTASYSRLVTNANTQLYTLNSTADSVFTGQFGGPPGGNILPVASLNNDVFVNERFAVSYSLEGRRTKLTLSGSQSRQDYQNSSQSSELSNVRLAVSRTLSGRISANAGLSWYRQDRQSNDSADTWQGRVGVSVRLGRKTSMNLGYYYNKRDGDRAASNYEENRASLGLNFTL